MIRFSRRLVSQAAAAAVLALTVPLAMQAQAQAQTATGPIKIGVLTIDAGPFATYASLVEDSSRAAVDMLNAEGGALGRKFEVVVQSHAGTPSSAIAAVNRLVQQGGVSFVTGQTPTSHSLAISPKLAALNALMIDVYSQGDDLMTKACQPNFFRVTTPDSVYAAMLREFVKKSGAKTWNLISPDYAVGHTFAAKFSDIVKAQGGTVQMSLFAAQGTNDFGSYITQLAKPADALMVTLYMSDGNSFAKQQKQFGLFDKYKTVLGNGFATEFQLAAQGDSVLGVLNGLSYHNTMPGERNAAFVKSYEARFKRKPIYTDADMMVALEMLRAAIVKAKSTDVSAVRTALAGLKAPTVFGEVEMRAADHTLIRQLGVAEVVRTPDGKATTFAMRSIEPGSALFPPPSPECKMQ
ncbi:MULTISPECIES: ABC transporter substrate-binding protein [unclassified Variovorax]|jgi:ABC-type branched-subunit amino acid transport system substrate-binding protein|uniref:ABC transporter substrate-binding protein n=2 Tax=Pseudomonadota TaxID=1224 RepID=UPI000ABCBA4D|nr:MULTISPECIES: ABC transporter substrate-binding protein [unclassified Variovorax]MBN8756627.1 ABC transporter substrate-binding protein [Variovorax sp.]